DLERQGRRVLVDARAGGGFALEVHGHVDGDLLALAHDDEVEVLDDLVHRVLLHILDERELALAVDLQVEHLVGLADDERRLVARQGDVHRLGAVAVDDGRDLAGGAQAAGEALAELGADVDDELVLAVVLRGGRSGLVLLGGSHGCTPRFWSVQRGPSGPVWLSVQLERTKARGRPGATPPRRSRLPAEPSPKFSG